MDNFLGKSVLTGLLICVCALAASAQKIDEQELKVDIGKISNSAVQLSKLDPVTFKYDVAKFKHLKLPAGKQYGFLASNVQSEFPAMVHEAAKVYESGKNNSKVAKYEEVQTAYLIPLLVAAVKEQQAEIELLKQEVKLLKAKSK